MFSSKSIVLFLNCRPSRPLRQFYDWRTRSDTIFAPTTNVEPKKGSPLGIIRISGAKTSQIIKCMTNLVTDRNINERSYNSSLKPRYLKLTKIYEPNTSDLIDIGLVVWFPKPNSYTGEDTCELHFHGSQAITTKLMLTLGRIEGLRPAEPGEFTRRAVENGKMSLVQAESLPELIASQTDQQRKIALQGLVGKTRSKYDNWIADLVKVLAHLEASIDFGEDELIGEQRVLKECLKDLDKLYNELKQFITVSSQCRDFAQVGARVAILGRPNAGKSTFMNMLCRRDKSIVSELSGTTRDVIEHSFELGGHTLTLMDTAGLKELSSLGNQFDKFTGNSMIEQHNSIEREGIKRALDAAKNSDMILYLIDATQLIRQGGLESITRELGETLSFLGTEGDKVEETPHIKCLHLVINKIDLCENDQLRECLDGLVNKLTTFVEELPGFGANTTLIEVSQLSCKTNKNMDAVIEKISSNLVQLSTCVGQSESSTDGLDYVNERHLSLLRATLRHLDRARQLDMRTIDEMAQHVRESVDYLSRIVGHVTNEQVIDIIFRDFCIGK